jgi:hypothetical protein
MNDTQGDEQPEFCKVPENLYRRTSTDVYYALFERRGKQFRRSLRTTDRPLANRRLADLREFDWRGKGKNEVQNWRRR